MVLRLWFVGVQSYYRLISYCCSQKVHTTILLVWQTKDKLSCKSMTIRKESDLPDHVKCKYLPENTDNHLFKQHIQGVNQEAFSQTI